MLERVVRPDGAVIYRSPGLLALGVPHLFTTRHGGSAGFDDALALGRACGAPDASELVELRQVHGGDVHVDDGSPRPERPEADAVVTDRSRRLAVVHVADCVPILVAEAGASRVAALHAGWRGLLAGVVARTLGHLHARGAVAAVGPCLSLERFEVGPDVAARFVDAGLGAFVVADRWPRPHVDLRAVARHQLLEAGVASVDVSDRCTWGHAADFFSYRRDVTHGGQSRTGRLSAVIALPAAATAPRASAPGR